MSSEPIDRFLSAGEIASAVRTRALSAQEVVDSALARIEEIDGQLGAFTVVLTESSREEARRIDLEVHRGSDLPLAGVPVAVKDHVWVAAAPATNGSRVLADFVPEEDCVAVDRLRKAGAVVIGKTNNPEFCYRADADTFYGLTRNPYDLARTPGGSSCGSAVAVATGMSALAVGTDGSGSIRCPAAFCGIVGHKPTHGLVPTRPGFRGWPTLSVHGPMARNVSDVAAMLAVMAGAHPADPLSVPADPKAIADAASGREDLSGLRVAVSPDFGFACLEPAVRSAFDEAVSVLGGLGCDVVEAHPSTAYDTVELLGSICNPETYASEGEFLERAGELTPYSVEAIRLGHGTSARSYLDAQHRREQLSRVWGTFFMEFDLLVSPGEQQLPFLMADSDAVHADPYRWSMDIVANLTRQPVTSVPCGLTALGLPHGIQIMAACHGDAALLRAAATIERHMRGPTPSATLGPSPDCRSTILCAFATA